MELSTNIGKVNITYHALERMGKRGITKEMIINTINIGERFKYIRDGSVLKGFYYGPDKIFVGIGRDGITTVINKVKINYINNLKATIK